MNTQAVQKWEKTKFKDFVKLQRGFDLPKQDRKDGIYPVIASTSITGYHDEYKVEPPCVTTGRSGALGEVLFVKSKCWPLNTALWVKDFKGNDPYFVYSKLKTLHLEQYNSGAGVPTLNRNHLDQIIVEVPSLPDQKQISDILSTYDDLIENNTRRIKILEQMAQAIYTEWFVNFHFPGHEKVKMVDSKTGFGKIPEGWAVKKIREVGRIVTGKTPPTSDANNFGDFMPFIKTPDLHNSIFCISTNENLSMQGVETQKNKIIPKDSIIVSCIGTVGVVGITTRDSQTNQQINSIVPTQTSIREYLYFVCVNLRDHLKNIGANGATMGNVNKEKFETIEILSPSDAILGLFHDTTQEMFDEIKSLSYQNQNLKNSRDFILPKLVSGEIEVSSI